MGDVGGGYNAPPPRPAARTPYGFGSLGVCPGHNRTNQTAACVARLSASMDDEFPPDTWELKCQRQSWRRMGVTQS